MNNKKTNSVTLSGVFINIFDTGVFILGDSGIGKSELAINLIDRDHQLIADDAIQFIKYNQQIIGQCPKEIQDMLLIRELGILNIRKMFGYKAICKEQQLDFIIKLYKSNTILPQHIEKTAKFNDHKTILDQNYPMIAISVYPGRNLAIIVECAVKKFRLMQKESHLYEKNMEEIL